MTSNNVNITFFDIPVFGDHPTPRAASPFTWATRLVLNYKKLPYTTVWVPLEQVESACKANNIPLAEGASTYTFPCLIDRTDPLNIVRIMDSHVIVEYLDKAYPERPVYPSDERTKEVEKHGLTKVVGPAGLLGTAQFAKTAPPFIMEYFERTAPGRFGMSLTDVVESVGPIGSASREALWEQTREGFEGFGLKEGDKWLDGASEPAYKDFVVLAWLLLLSISMGEEGSDKIKGWSDGKWKRYWEAAEEYMVVV